MADMIKCCGCGKVVMLVECEEIKQDAIVTCAKDKNSLDINCWDCSFRPTNSKECLEWIKEEKEKHPNFKQFTNEEVFD